MKVRFKQPRSIDGKMYSAGMQELDDNLDGHWFLEEMIKSEDVVILEGPKKRTASPYGQLDKNGKLDPDPRPAQNRGTDRKKEWEPGLTPGKNPGVEPDDRSIEEVQKDINTPDDSKDSKDEPKERAVKDKSFDKAPVVNPNGKNKKDV